jgi:hypothetical protein
LLTRTGDEFTSASNEISFYTQPGRLICANLPATATLLWSHFNAPQD